MQKQKKLLIPVVVLILIIFLGLGVYWFLTSLETNEANNSQKTSQFFTDEISSFSVKEIKVPNQPQVEQKAFFFLKTDKNSYRVGETFNLQVMVFGKGEEVDGVEFLLNFDPWLVQVGEPQISNFFSLYPQKTIDNQKGRVKVIALQSLNESKPLNTQLVINLPVTVVQKGNLEFSFNKDKTHIVAYGGQELLKSAESLTIKLQ
jgi:hypothetical protein